jgi:hypothetical protein
VQRGVRSSVDVLGLVRRLIERKQSLFADGPRFIFDVRTQQSGDRVHVMAASVWRPGRPTRCCRRATRAR